ncbi:MAG: hypothetical protein AB7C97_05680 [Oscillospiraceae bacterium]
MNEDLQQKCPIISNERNYMVYYCPGIDNCPIKNDSLEKYVISYQCSKLKEANLPPALSFGADLIQDANGNIKIIGVSIVPTLEGESNK